MSWNASVRGRRLEEKGLGEDSPHGEHLDGIMVVVGGLDQRSLTFIGSELRFKQQHYSKNNDLHLALLLERMAQGTFLSTQRISWDPAHGRSWSHPEYQAELTSVVVTQTAPVLYPLLWSLSKVPAIKAVIRLDLQTGSGEAHTMSIVAYTGLHCSSYISGRLAEGLKQRHGSYDDIYNLF